MVAVAVMGSKRGDVIRMASAVEPEWLLDDYEDRIDEVEARALDEKTETVMITRSLRYAGLTLEESRLPAPADEGTAEVLARAARDRGLSAVAETGAIESLIARCRFAHSYDEAVPPLNQESLTVLLSEVAVGCRSFDDLRKLDLASLLFYQLSAGAKQSLARLAPKVVALPGRSKGVTVQYPEGRDPFIESYLQDFFGLSDGPRVAGGKVPLVLHLWAPNKRAVQVTTDLAGFWDRHYPALSKTLGRRYSRHFWPEDPRTAQARRHKTPLTSTRVSRRQLRASESPLTPIPQPTERNHR